MRDAPLRFPLALLALLTLPLLLAGCGEAEPGAASDSGVRGSVLLGPQCPVESVDEPCEDAPAARVAVLVSRALPGEAYGAGEPVGRTRTDADGRFELALPPGEYVVTAEAGMSCEFMDARVSAGDWTEVDVPCDTGIRGPATSGG